MSDHRNALPVEPRRDRPSTTSRTGTSHSENGARNGRVSAGAATAEEGQVSAPSQPAAVGGKSPFAVFGRFEASFTATQEDPLPGAVELFGDFTGPKGKVRTIRGFWYGCREWRLRFMPDVAGKWTFVTRCVPEVPGLHRRPGSFVAVHESNAKSPFLLHGPVMAPEGKRHLAHADGTPFFWLGDTVWNGPMLSRSAEDWDRYLAFRAKQDFNTIQFVMTQWRTAKTNPEGQVAWTGQDPIWINPRWFDRIDRRMNAIEARGMLAAPVMIWTLGRDEINPAKLPEAEIIKLARYMVARYGAHHVAWILNGDGRYYGESAEKWKRIGRAVFDLPGFAPVIQHPGGMQWPHDSFEDESWIDVVGYQSGHGDDAETLQWLHSGPPALKWPGYRPRPIINLEPPYEHHICYQSRRRHTAYNIRRSSYWSVLCAPPAGLTYGAHGVWGWEETRRPPTDHESTGVADPWHVAMRLSGARHMTHLAALMAALPWERLVPDRSLVVERPKSLPKPGKVHLVFSRNLDGETAVWVDGIKRNAGWTGGDFSTWDADTDLMLGNESTGDFGWRGTFHHVAIFDRAFAPEDVAAAQKGERGRLSASVAEYAFEEGGGSRVQDVSGRGLDLKISNPSATRWIKGGLVLRGETEIRSVGPATPLIQALRKSRAATFELSLTPAEWNARACGRILAIEVDRWCRNVALTQLGTEFSGHVRTSNTAANAEPGLLSGEVPNAFEFVASVRTAARDHAVLYLPVGGSVRVGTSSLRPGLTTEWFDPRTGRRRPAVSAGRGVFRAPDARDWVLVFHP